MWKELSPVNFGHRAFFQMEYDNETLTWAVQSARRSPAWDVTYASVYGWRDKGGDGLPELAQPELILNNLVFDFDSDVPELAQKDAITLLTILEDVYEVDLECVGCYFSGYKGFHIVLPIELFVDGLSRDADRTNYGLSVTHPEAIRRLAIRLAGGLSTMDTAIYDARRLFRIPGAINPHTGLYKVPIYPGELRYLTMDKIRAHAVSPKPIQQYEQPSFNEQLSLMMIEEMSSVTDPVGDARYAGVPLPVLFSPARKGNRNNAAAALAGLLVKAIPGDLPLLTEIMTTWNRTNQHPLPERELRQVTTGIYKRYTPFGGTNGF